MPTPTIDAGVPLIDDSTPVSGIVNPTGFDGRGLERRDFSSDPIGASAGSKGKLPDHMRIAVSLWPDMIREKREKKTGMRFIRDRYQIGCLDQNGTNYCWGNGPTQAVMIARVAAGLVHVPLSPASVCAQIKGYRNVGGWGTQFMAFAAKNGIAPSSMWPNNYWQNAKYLTEECKQAMLQYQVLEYYEIEPGDWEGYVSALLLGFVGACGYNWWGHETTSVDLALDEKGNVITDNDNSWGERYGNGGRFYLSGRKAIPDDCVMVRMAYAGAA